MDLLFNPELGPPSFVYGVIGVVYLIVLAAAIFVNSYRKRIFEAQHLNARLAKTVSLTGIVLGASGVVLVVLRLLGIPVLSAPALIYLLILISLAALADFVYYFRRVYPARLAAFQAEELRKRYAARPKSKPTPPPSRVAHARKQGKRRR